MAKPSTCSTSFDADLSLANSRSFWRGEIARTVPRLDGLPAGGAAPSMTKEIQTPMKFSRGVAHGDGAIRSTLWLIEYVCAQLGLDDLAQTEVLDFGCEVKFTEAFINGRLDIKRYVGVDVDGDMINWLREAVDDPRFEYCHLDAHNDRYNPDGQPLSAAIDLPDRRYDVRSHHALLGLHASSARRLQGHAQTAAPLRETRHSTDLLALHR